MKFVLDKNDTAAALCMTGHEFGASLDRLYSFGFPRPVVGLGERWALIEVMNWVNRSSANNTTEKGIAPQAATKLTVIK